MRAPGKKAIHNQIRRLSPPGALPRLARLVWLTAGVLAAAGCTRLGFDPRPSDERSVLADSRSGADVSAGDASSDGGADSRVACQVQCIRVLAGVKGQEGLRNGAANQALFRSPWGIAVDDQGVIYVTDRDNNCVRRIANGQVTTFAGTGAAGFADGPAAAAQFGGPRGLATDGQGAVYVADSNNHRIRKIAGGVVTTVAGAGVAGFADGPAGSARFDSPYGVAVRDDGALYVADRENHRLRLVLQGQVSTLVGTGVSGARDGLVASALVGAPQNVAVGPAGALWFVQSVSSLVRRMNGGVVSTVAGSGGGYLNGPAGAAKFDDPSGIAADGSSVFVADEANGRLRMVTAGAVSTLVGSDGAFVYDLARPKGVALSGDKIYLTEGADNVVLEIRR